MQRNVSAFWELLDDNGDGLCDFFVPGSRIDLDGLRQGLAFAVRTEGVARDLGHAHERAAQAVLESGWMGASEFYVDNDWVYADEPKTSLRPGVRARVTVRG